MLPSAPASPSAAHSILEKLHWLYACAVLAPSPLPHALCPHSTDTSNLTIYVCVCRSLPARHVRSLMGGRAWHLLGRRMVSVCWARVLQLERGLPGQVGTRYTVIERGALQSTPLNAPFGVWVGGVNVCACAKQPALSSIFTVEVVLSCAHIKGPHKSASEPGCDHGGGWG